jgi:hypothetical protein
MGGINLDLDEDSQRKQHALYNTASKYQNIKTEMAAEFVREMFAREAGAQPPRSSLIAVLKQLFRTFFPGKEFLGPLPNKKGTLGFPVRLSDGSTHDIDDLSSGEKEIVFGYLRLRKSAPRNSVLLIDEPELHLNPALVRGLPGFYNQFLGKELNNQVWMITHSDALIRDAVRISESRVFHMSPATDLTNDQAGQLRPISAESDAESLIIDLVGDLAAYRPLARILIVEGDRAEVDVEIIETLFPDFVGKLNLITGGSRDHVRKLRALLQGASGKAGLSKKVFAIVDRDWERSQLDDGEFQWDRFHIENYLLEADVIAAVLSDVKGKAAPNQATIASRLHDIAESTLDDLVRHRLQVHAHDLLDAQINKVSVARSSSLSGDLAGAVQRCASAISNFTTHELSVASFEAEERKWRATYKAALSDGTWVSEFKGRDILRAFAGSDGVRMRYEDLRNLLTAEMRRRAHKPAGMTRVLESVLSG